jgi:hypothetical protein
MRRPHRSRLIQLWNSIERGRVLITRRHELGCDDSVRPAYRNGEMRCTCFQEDPLALSLWLLAWR